MKTSKLGAAASAVGLGLILANCSGGSEPAARDTQVTTGMGTGTASSSGGAGSIGTAESNAISNNNISVASTTVGGSGGANDSCQQFGIEFTPDIPTVYVLVDRSSSMWDNMFWDPLRDGVLDVIQRLNQDVRFGLGTFTGNMGDSSCPLDLEDAGVIDRNVYQTISDFYTAIARPNMATETPTPAAVQWAQTTLEADAVTFPGPKFILLVTDGNPDWCDNGQMECRADSLVRALQDAYTANIPTFVVALPDPGIDPNWLTAYANAGMGQPVGPMGGNEAGALADVQYCSAPTNGTETLFPYAFPMGTYSAAMGTAMPYQVDPAQRDTLVSEIGGVVAGVKSCTFDLQGELTIVPGLEAEGAVYIETAENPGGEAQPYDPSGVDGWKVNDGTQVELVGSSCDKLRDLNTTGISFGFPCDIVVPK